MSGREGGRGGEGIIGGKGGKGNQKIHYMIVASFAHLFILQEKGLENQVIILCNT